MEGSSFNEATKDKNNSDIIVSPFDFSVENHFKAMNIIHKPCGTEKDDEEEEIVMQHFNSRVSFLKFWKDFKYDPRNIRFSCDTEDEQGKEIIGEVNLPQFSAATVPKTERISKDSSNDFVLYVGGHVWALDWCPNDHQQPDSRIKCEYLAVAAHPPGSSYHKIGAPLTGRGIVQIWCILHAAKEENLEPVLKNQRPKSRKQVVEEEIMRPLKRPRGRPKKESLDDSSRGNQVVEESATQSCNAKEEKPLPLKKARGRPRKHCSTKRNNVKESSVSLGTEIVPALAVNVIQESIEFLALTEGIKSSEEHTLLKGNDLYVGLDKSKRENHSIQANSLQLCNAEEKTPLPSKKARGRPRKRSPIKKNAIKEVSVDLDVGNALVSAYAVDSSQVSSGFLALTEGTKSTEEHALLKDCDIDDALGDLIREKQIVQVASPHLRNVEEKIPLKKTRGRPRMCSPTAKKDTNKSIIYLDTENESVPALEFDLPQVSSALTESARISEDHASSKGCNNDVGLNEEDALLKSCDTDFVLETETLEQFRCKMFKKKRKMIDKTKLGSPADDVSRHFLAHDEDMDLHVNVLHENNGYDQDASASPLNVANSGSLEVRNISFDPPKDVSMPRVVLCLAHNGKVTWDVKWRPPTGSGTIKHSMGYLAVLLGNGSLEVWEVPSPRTVEVLYTGCTQERTDPRFVKLEPVFRCSKLKSGDRHSIPLTVEWSTASPHDLLLAGCHDGTVALWKFSVSCLSQDTRPLLCFSADTLPIRALAWAPDVYLKGNFVSCSDEESANIVVTAGDGGVRFWDIRDPHRPLWDVNPVRRFIYSLDWLQDPRCVIMSFDDGTLRILSLSKAAYDVPVTGRPFVGTQYQGLHSYFCSSYPIWSVQASRLTGQVVYCSADGSVLHFQLTSKAVDKDPSRNRAPHFLCGSLTEEDGCLTLNAPLADIPLPIKKPLKECVERSINGLLADSNQVKRGNDQTPDREPLDLIYDGDPSFQIGSGDTVTAPESKTTSKKSNKRILDKVLVQVDNFHKGDNQEQSQTEFEIISPKIVAMHRVRWNMNKGSERWLCYGGAAGIVRCQEISMSSTGGVH